MQMVNKDKIVDQVPETEVSQWVTLTIKTFHLQMELLGKVNKAPQSIVSWK